MPLCPGIHIKVMRLLSEISSCVAWIQGWVLVVVWSADNALAESVTINNGPSHGWDAAWNIAAASAENTEQYS